MHGKLFDIAAVLIGFVLLTLNLGASVLIAATVDYGVIFFGAEGIRLGSAERLLGHAISFASIWMLLYFIYRYVPSRPISLGTAVVAATFTAIAHESFRFGFSWYATEVANYGSTLGNLATVGVLFFWIYYESLVFILGGEVAQVFMMRKAPTEQKREREAMRAKADQEAPTESMAAGSGALRKATGSQRRAMPMDMTTVTGRPLLVAYLGASRLRIWTVKKRAERRVACSPMPRES